MTTILTASGRDLSLLYMQPADMLAHDIAHALAQINRFTGHARRPYSVAEHSLLVLEIIEREFPATNVHGRLAALMHDAHEAYVGDMATPLKRLVGPAWDLMEAKAERTLRSAYALHTAAADHAAVVKAADLIALATERAQLMPPGGSPWEVLDGVQPVTWVSLMAPERVAMPWTDWRDAWLATLEALDFARGEALFPVVQP